MGRRRLKRHEVILIALAVILAVILVVRLWQSFEFLGLGGPKPEWVN
jgi:hypothetical protein